MHPSRTLIRLALLLAAPVGGACTGTIGVPDVDEVASQIDNAGEALQLQTPEECADYAALCELALSVCDGDLSMHDRNTCNRIARDCERNLSGYCADLLDTDAGTSEPTADAGTSEPTADAGTSETTSDAGTEEPSVDSGTAPESDGGTTEPPPPEPVAGGCAPLSSDADAPPADARYVDPALGSDSNPGSLASPWRTLGHAFGRIGAGDTLVLRGGTYFEGDLDLDAAGTASSPVTIQNYPGERPRIDATPPTLRGAGDVWELVDASIHLYRSVRSDFGTGVFIGKFEYNGNFYNLVPYADMPADGAQGMADLTSTEHNVTTGARYVGPGVYNDGGRLYIRLEPSTPESLNGRTFDLPTDLDPNHNTLHVNGEVSVINVRGSHIRIRGLDLVFGRVGVEIKATAHHVEVSNVSFRVATGAVLLRDGVSHITVDGVRVEGDFPPWVAWTDHKGGDGQSHPARHYNLRPSAMNGSDVSYIELRNSCLNRVFDGSVMEGHDLSLHHNTYLVLDDMIQLGSSSYNVEIYNNFVRGAGPSHYGKGNSPEPGTKYIHHNVINNDIDMLWGRNDPEGILRFNYTGWHGPKVFPTHTSSLIGDGDPWKIYHNTVVFDGSRRSGGIGFELWNRVNSTGVAHEVYNNIFVETGGGVLVDDMSAVDGPQIYDGNVYYRAVSSSLALFNNVVDSSGTHDHDSLAELLSSRAFTDSQNFISTGWESRGIEADPGLDADYHPSAAGPAAGGAVEVPLGFPGSRDSFRGALEPR